VTNIEGKGRLEKEKETSRSHRCIISYLFQVKSLLSPLQDIRDIIIPDKIMISSKEKRILTAMTKETKKKRLAHIRRHTSSLPKISSYDTTFNVEDGSKYGEYSCKFIHVLSTLCYLCSLFVLMMEISNFPVPILGFGLLLIKILVLDLFFVHHGKVQILAKNSKSKESTSILISISMICD
jgi:hypothetical protein